MDPLTTRQFRERWLAIAAFEDAEQQASTMDERWQQMNRLLAMAIALNLDLTEREEEAVRLRWARLKGSA